MKKQLRQRIKLAILSILTTALIVSCRDNGFIDKPNPTGKAYELGIVLNNCTKENLSIKSLCDILTQTVEGLPQDEPLFDVSTIPIESFSTSFKLLRNLIIINVDPEIKTEELKYRSNVWAKDQSVVIIDVPSIEALENFLVLHETKIPSFFLQSERERYKAYCKKTNVKAITDTLMSKFGIDISFPSGYSIYSNSPDFVWIGKETNLIQQGVLVYSFNLNNLHSLTLETLLTKRDSILKQNVSGKSMGSYMTTEYEFVPVSKILQVGGEQAMTVVGLWKINGDIMGGPFYLTAIPEVNNRRVVVMDGFVFYPEKPSKRNYIRQLEAIMQTYSTNPKSHESSKTN